MNNEPRAWINQFMEDSFLDWEKDDKARNSIPLYTHLAKTLTDEEIKAVYGEYFDVENCDWLHLQCIQAILRKAQEK
jgi:dipeptidase